MVNTAVPFSVGYSTAFIGITLFDAGSMMFTSVILAFCQLFIEIVTLGSSTHNRCQCRCIFRNDFGIWDTFVTQNNIIGRTCYKKSKKG